MKKTLDFKTALTGQKVEAQADKLIRDFQAHAEQFRAAHPDMDDTREIFEGWIIQKVAALQLAVLELERRLPVAHGVSLKAKGIEV